MTRLRTIILALSPLLASAGTAVTVTNCARHAQMTTSRMSSGGCIPVDMRVTVSAINIDGRDSFAVQDETGFARLRPKTPIAIPAKPGDLIRLTGYLKRNEFDETISYPTNITVLAHGTPPKPVAISFADLKTGRYESQLVRITGVIRNIFTDEVDPDFKFIVLTDNRDIAYVIIGKPQFSALDSQQLLGRTASITGICSVNRHSLSRQIFRRIPQTVTCVSNGIAIRESTDPDPEAIPSLDRIAGLAPKDIPLAALYRTCGRVLAVWNRNTVLLHAQSGQIVRIRIAGQELPAVGDIIESVGFPEGNLFTCGLDCATWKHRKVQMPPEQPPESASIREIMENEQHAQKISVHRHGQTLCLTGKLHGQSGHADDNRFLLESDGYFIPVDTGTSPNAFNDVPVGSVVSVSGVCVMDIDDWRPTAAFPRVRGFMLVLKSPDDIRIIRTPSWWTPQRLSATLFALLVVLLGSALLNVTLRKLVARRERELTDEIGARISSECKVQERTRLAVELHDAISQNLTGVALQLRTVGTFAASLPATARQHLAIAARTLDSCRDELRFCLWDLRNNALEQEDMNDAIRKTIAPHVGTAELVIRFNVPRAKLTDNTAHNLLHILRELASNAVRHGHATQLRIAGCLDNGKLLFSISDNGCGFDPDNCPGMESGHFGLLGIRERLEGLDGAIEIASGNKGTRVSAAIPAPEDKDSKI